MSRAAVLLFLALGSCSSHQYFRPREVVMVQAPSGYPATQYALGEEDNRVGRLNVWSRGAWSEDRDDESWTVIHLGLEITNISDGNLFIEADEVQLHSVAAEDRLIEVLEPRTRRGRPTIPSEQVGRMDFEFLVDPDLEPTSIESFAARWVVRNETDGRYRDLTVFQADGYYGYGYWGYGYWGYPYAGYPYWHYPYGYWGWGYPWFPYW